MPILVTNSGEVIALSLLVNKATVTEDLKYCLFATNVTPSELDTSVTYTLAAGGGYLDKTLAGVNCTVTGGAPSSATLQKTAQPTR